MLSYRDAQNALHVRLVDFSLQEYLFVLQTALGEDEALAYASVYDTAEFNRKVPGEDEETYLEQFKNKAQVLLGQQHCVQLRQYLSEEYQGEIQRAASKLEEYNFTGEDIKRLLSNLLRNRSESLDEASVKDILSLVKSMFDSGYLDSDDAWSRHFISIPTRFNAMCPSCNRELSVCEGLDIRCQCGQVFRWDETERRFWPLPAHL